MRQHNINKFTILPNNIIKRGPAYYNFRSTEQPDELNGITQQKGKLIRLPSAPKISVKAYKFYIED